MIEGIRQICVLSVFCGVVMNLTPKGGVKRVMTVLCAVALLCAILSNLQTVDYSVYRLELAQLREREASLTQNGKELEERLNRLVIEEELRAYILDKAAEMELEVYEVSFALEWSMDGLWVPYSVTIRYRGEESAREQLQELIKVELGIQEQQQIWNRDE